MAAPTITRTPNIDDDGTLATGTVWNNTWLTALYNAIDAVIAALYALFPTLPIPATNVCDGRLTLTTGVPVTAADVTGATTVFWTPYKGSRIALYDGVSAWSTIAFAETALALGTLTAALPYDVFAFNNAGVLALEKLAWTNGTTRATALVLQDGVLVKSGATTRRYLGTFYTTATTTTEDSAAKRYLWNYYNRERRVLLRREATANWTYTTNTLRQANANAANQVEIVVGVAEVDLALHVGACANNTTAGTGLAIGIGQDSTTAASAGQVGGEFISSGSGVIAGGHAMLSLAPTIGRHFYAWLEYSQAAGATSWFSSNAISQAAGLNGTIEG